MRASSCSGGQVQELCDTPRVGWIAYPSSPGFDRIACGPSLFCAVDGEGVVVVSGPDRGVVDVMAGLCAVDPVGADRATLLSQLRDVAGLRRWLDGRETSCGRELGRFAEDDPTLFPEHDIAAATRSGLRAGARVTARGRTGDAIPELGAALAAGSISGEHIDVVTAALRDLTPVQRRSFAAHGARLAELASRFTADEFRREVARLVRTILADDGEARLVRQRRANRLRAWFDKHTGMLRLSGEFDPETGAALVGRLNNQIETLFHQSVPDLCPDDPAARQDFLRAHALIELTKGNGGGPGKVEMAITIDLQTLAHGWHPGSRVDCGADGIILPLDTIRRLALYADIIPVLLDNNGVVLKMGRTRRLATADQRRALRAMYKRCAIPGCETPVGRCTPHHCIDWNNGGFTDLELLVPICKHHHTMIHARGWTLTLGPNRTLRISARDGTIMTTGPPHEQWS